MERAPEIWWPFTGRRKETAGLPILRVLNPRKRRRTVKHKARRRTSRRRTRHHARRNPGAGELIIMGNPHRRHKNARSRRRNPRRHHSRRQNPIHVRRYRRHRHNPTFDRDSLSLALYGSVGAVVTRAGTQAVLGDKNTGIMGYVGNGVVAGVLGYAGEKFVSPRAGQGLLVGGLIGLVLRIAKEQFFASSPLAAQLSLQGMGDADFALSGYVNDPFTLPTTSSGPDQLTVTPNSYWAQPAASKKGMSGYDSSTGAPVVDRWKSPWG
jgi:hypothetical protein